MRFLAKAKLSEHKYKTPEGYLVCVDAVLSRTGKQQYRRAELFGDSCERADELIDVDRLEADVFDEKAMASFENKPICVEHPDEDVNVANHNDLAVGFVRDIKRGTDNGQPVMLGTLVITDENAIDLVESGEYNELSCGYDCDIADDEHPTQKNIRGNHVALCKQGRAGIARIVDSVKDSLVSAEKLEIGMRINYRGKVYTVEGVTSNKQYKGEYDLLLKADDGSQRVLETGGSDRFTVIDSEENSKGDNMTDAKVYAASEHSKVGNDFYGYILVEHPKYGDFYVSVKKKLGGRNEVQLDGTGWSFIKAKGYTAEQKAWIAAHKAELERMDSGDVIKDSLKSFEVSFVKDDVTYIRKVKASDLQNAIKIAQKDMPALQPAQNVPAHIVFRNRVKPETIVESLKKASTDQSFDDVAIGNIAEIIADYKADISDAKLDRNAVTKHYRTYRRVAEAWTSKVSQRVANKLNELMRTIPA